MSVSYNIKNYTYKSIDNSLLSPYYRIICDYLIYYIPINISPNIITLSGLSFIFFSTFVTIFLKNIIGVSYTSLICAFCVLSYQLIDTLDGMQCKRVNMYFNPTAELFDHGCDSISAMLILYNIVSITDLITNYYHIALIFYFLTYVNFYMSTWEHKYTGIMLFRSGFSNPTESSFLIQIFFLFVAYIPHIFHNLYIVYGLTFIMSFATLSNFYNIVINTFSKNTHYDKYIALLPVFISFVHLLCNPPFLILLFVPMILSVLTLIWSEITKQNYNIFPLLVSHLLYIVDPYTSLIFSLLMYYNLFVYYLDIMCKELNMEYFYSIPN